jgi:hypothetical protein
MLIYSNELHRNMRDIYDPEQNLGTHKNEVFPKFNEKKKVLI